MKQQNGSEENVPTGRRGASRRAVLSAGTGAAVTAAAVVAGETPAHAGAGRSGTRIPVAPGVEVNITDLNGGNRGTVVFVPGWPLASTTFEYNYLFLADHGYRAIGLDQRGFGLSDAPYGPYTYDVWARDILTVLKALSLRDVTLVGHSMGGAVALRHAARFGSRVGRLVLAEASAPRYVYGPQSADLAAGIAGLISGYATDRAATIRGLTANFFSTHTDIATDPFLQFFERQCLDQASLPASRAGLIALRDDDLTADLARVTVPTRVFHAINDKIVPLDHGQALAAGIRNARLVTFGTAGHAVYVDEKDKFNAELLKFIR
ncbi:alpha/beta hydrolase [Actinoplanes sp. NPDC048791]|uniref:alpha/beta fold hydrolase n=1 Tax=Actinoplanes sp. NPDC048791 TaxID=3154623 RepID=UPI0033EAF91A